MEETFDSVFNAHLKAREVRMWMFCKTGYLANVRMLKEPPKIHRPRESILTIPE